jgi:hypothetical protein
MEGHIEHIKFSFVHIIPHYEHRSSEPRLGRLGSDQYIFHFLFRTI